MALNIRKLGSKIWDQLNIADSGRTFQNQNPTGDKSAVQQLGQFGGQTARALAGNTAKFVNTGNLGARQIIDTIRMQAATQTNNPVAFRNAQNASQADYNRFTTQGGALNTGTVFQSPQEAQSGQLSTVARRVGGGTLGTAAEVVPFARGATLMRTGGKVLPRVGLAAAEGALYGAAGGAANELTQGDGFNVKNVAKSAAVGAGLGAVGPLAGDAARGVTKAVKAGGIAPVAERQVGSVKIPGATGEKPTVSSTKPLDVNAYIDQMAAEQKAARQSSFAEKASAAGKGAKSKFVDTYSPIEDIVKQSVKDGATIAPEKNITYAIDRALRGDQIAGQYIKDNGLTSIIQNAPDPKAFDQYLIAKHSQDLARNGVKTGRDAASDKALVTQLAPQYEAHAQALNQYNQQLLDKAVEYGLVSKETAAFLKKKYPNYVPVNRIFTGEELQGIRGNGVGPASISTQTVVRKLKGSGRVIESPLDSIIKKTQTVIEQGERNKAASILGSYHELPGNPLQLRKMKSTEPVGTKPVISYLEGGRVRRYETTPEVAAAAKSLNKEQLGLVGKLLSYPTRVLRLGATGVNVGFAAANVVKDIGTAFVNSKHPIRSSIANPDVFLDALKAATNHGSQQYGELVREGAGGTSFDIARNNPVRNVKYIRAQRSTGAKLGYVVTHPAQLLRAVENTIGRSEEFGRALQYFGNKKAFLTEGDTVGNARLRAAHEARNNTVNFARAGDYGRTLNTVLPYLNAGVQGSRLLIRNLRDRPAQTASKIALTAFFPVAATTAWALSDPERKKVYDNIPAYEKENNIIIVPPHPKPDGSNVIKIPISQEVSSLSNIVRNGIETLHKDATFNFAGMAGDLIGSGTSLQAQSPRQLAGQLTPQAFKPIGEAMANQNLYFGNKIVPDALKNLKPEDQVASNTSGTARVIGRVTGTSPLQIDNALRTATGGAGQNIVNLSDQALAATGVISPDQVKGKNFGKSVTSRFVGANVPSQGAQYFSTLEAESKKQGLAGKDYSLLNALKSKEIDPNGKPIPQNEQDALNSASIRANNPRVVVVETAVAKKLASKTGQPLDPIYNLTPAQQQTYYRIQSTPYKSDDYNQLTSKAHDWLPAFQQQRSTFFNHLNSTNSTGVTPTARVKYPTFSQDTQGKLDTYFATTDSAERAQLLKSNPDVATAFDKINQYTNARRVAQGYDPFKDYPKTDPEAEKALQTYMGLPSGTGARSQWIKANSGVYANIQKYLADTAAWQLANNAGEAKYAGNDLNQKALKAAYSLGQYDIFKGPNGQYSINPGAVYASAQAKSSSKRSSSYAKTAFKRASRVKSSSGRGKKVSSKGTGPKVSFKKAGSNSKPKYAVSLKKNLV